MNTLQVAARLNICPNHSTRSNPPSNRHSGQVLSAFASDFSCIQAYYEAGALAQSPVPLEVKPGRNGGGLDGGKEWAPGAELQLSEAFYKAVRHVRTAFLEACEACVLRTALCRSWPSQAPRRMMHMYALNPSLKQACDAHSQPKLVPCCAQHAAAHATALAAGQPVGAGAEPWEAERACRGGSEGGGAPDSATDEQVRSVGRSAGWSVGQLVFAYGFT